MELQRQKIERQSLLEILARLQQLAKNDEEEVAVNGALVDLVDDDMGAIGERLAALEHAENDTLSVRRDQRSGLQATSESRRLTVVA